jgi:hypothetical protein
MSVSALEVFKGHRVISYAFVSTRGKKWVFFARLTVCCEEQVIFMLCARFCITPIDSVTPMLKSPPADSAGNYLTKGNMLFSFENLRTLNSSPDSRSTN